VKIIGGSLSPWAKRVLITLEEKEITYEHENYYPMGSPSQVFLEKNPLGTIPVLEFESAFLPDSTAICHLLDHLYQKNNFSVNSGWESAEIISLQNFISTFFSKIEAPLFFQIVLNPMLGRPVIREEIETARDEASQYLKYFECRLQEGEYLMGDSLSMVDISLCSVLINLLHSGEHAMMRDYKNLSRYTEKILNRPSFKKIIGMDLEQLGKHSQFGSNTPILG